MSFLDLPDDVIAQALAATPAWRTADLARAACACTRLRDVVAERCWRLKAFKIFRKSATKFEESFVKCITSAPPPSAWRDLYKMLVVKHAGMAGNHQATALHGIVANLLRCKYDSAKGLHVLSCKPLVFVNSQRMTMDYAELEVVVRGWCLRMLRPENPLVRCLFGVEPLEDAQRSSACYLCGKPTCIISHAKTGAGSACD